MIILLCFYSLQDVIIYYNEAEYLKVISISDSVLMMDSTLSNRDRVSIRTYRAFSMVAIGDTTKAKSEFKKILKLDPEYNLNPAFVSPKINNVFKRAVEEFKKEKIEAVKHLPPPIWKSLTLPGTYQEWKGFRKRGKVFKKTSLFLMSGVLITIVSTEALHRVYLSKTEQEEINKWYNYYNISYKTRNTLILSMGIIYLLNSLDVLFTE